MNDKERQRWCGELAKELEMLQYEVRFYPGDHDKIKAVIKLLRERKARLYY
jgi:hypothetical protein